MHIHKRYHYNLNAKGIIFFKIKSSLSPSFVVIKYDKYAIGMENIIANKQSDG